MKRVIGNKSMGYQHAFAGLSMTFIVLSIFLIYMFFIDRPTNDVMILIIFFVIPGLTVLFIWMWWTQKQKPTDIISHDDSHFYIDRKEGMLIIPFIDVIQVVPDHSRGKSIAYSFGDIIIHTSSETYKVGILAEVDDVSLTMMKLIKEKNSQQS